MKSVTESMGNMTCLQARQITILQEEAGLTDEALLELAKKVTGDDTISYEKGQEPIDYEKAAKLIKYLRGF